MGPTGDTGSLNLAVKQSRGLVPDAPGFGWDVLIDLGDWTASQEPPGNDEGILLAKCLNETLGEDRGCFYTLAGNHDGDPKGWIPGDFTRKYVNPLGESEFRESSGFSKEMREAFQDRAQVLEYPGTRWDRYLLRTGNVIWIMLSDRNEYDGLAESRGDKSGRFQAGRGSTFNMPNGGYPSGSVTLATFRWWKKVVEDPAFQDNRIITTHHLMPANTTIATTTGDQSQFHGRSGSVSPDGQIAGQLYWIREYDKEGMEIQQYAQTRPFMDYLRDHHCAITAWIGGHTHVDFPEQMLDYRGIYMRKYGVTFLSVGALTARHGGGSNQMSRLLTFENGKDEAIINVYIHRSKSGIPEGWYAPAIRSIPLGKKFECPPSSTNLGAPLANEMLLQVPESTGDLMAPRYSWNLNAGSDYDFNNAINVIGEDGSPYGRYQGMDEITYSEDIPLKEGKSLDLRRTGGRVAMNAPYQPEMNWGNLTINLWLKTSSHESQEVISYSSARGVGKFRLWYDGHAWIWEVSEGKAWKTARWESVEINSGLDWHYFTAIADDETGTIQLWVDAKLAAKESWAGKSLTTADNHQFVIGASGDRTDDAGTKTWSRPFNGLIDEVSIFDRIVYPSGW